MKTDNWIFPQSPHVCGLHSWLDYGIICYKFLFNHESNQKDRALGRWCRSAFSLGSKQKERGYRRVKLEDRLLSSETHLTVLEQDTKRIVSEQLERLAANTEKGSLEEEGDLGRTLKSEAESLKRAGQLHQKLHRSCVELADEIDTQLRESYHYDEKMMRSRLIKPAPTNAQIDFEEKKSKHFAQGITFYKLFWIFFIGCFAGVVVEVLWCVITRGHYESRAGLIYGPFNPVYGLGAWALSAALYRYRNRNPIFSFIGGFIIGSVIEYLCSWVQETVFGSTSWDYSNMPFNLNGRICLLYSLFWGVLGVLWIKEFYPRAAKWILKIPNKIGKPLTWVLLVFMVFNCFMSAATVLRWIDRRAGDPADNAFEEWMDVHYPDMRMQKIFSNLEFVENTTE